MSSEEKARELVNQYYEVSKGQLEAIIRAKNSMNRALSQECDSLYFHVFEKQDFDLLLIKSRIKELKWRVDVLTELERMENLVIV